MMDADHIGELTTHRKGQRMKSGLHTGTAVVRSTQPPSHLDLDAVQRTHILKVLDQTAWRIRGTGGAAHLLGLKPSTLESKMNKLGIRRSERS
jgi:transcriptional regulator with GAF, ATPase, and Fis domain